MMLTPSIRDWEIHINHQPFDGDQELDGELVVYGFCMLLLDLPLETTRTPPS